MAEPFTAAAASHRAAAPPSTGMPQQRVRSGFLCVDASEHVLWPRCIDCSHIATYGGGTATAHLNNRLLYDAHPNVFICVCCVRTSFRMGNNRPSPSARAAQGGEKYVYYAIIIEHL